MNEVVILRIRAFGAPLTIQVVNGVAKPGGEGSAFLSVLRDIESKGGWFDRALSPSSTSSACKPPETPAAPHSSASYSPPRRPSSPDRTHAPAHNASALPAAHLAIRAA